MERARQVELLEGLLLGPLVPSAIAVHGAPSTGKTATLKAVLNPENVSYVSCDVCTSVRVCLQRTLREILVNTGTGGPEDAVSEHVDAFCDVLNRHWRAASFSTPHIVILDRIDRLQESPASLYRVLSRLPELKQISNLCVVFVYSTPEPRALLDGLPHVWFPRYTTEEATAVLVSMADELFTVPPMWHRFRDEFLRVITSVLAPYAGTDVALLRRCALRLWPPFIEGVDLKGPPPAFPKHYQERQELFMSESSFIDALPAPSDVTMDRTASFLIVAAYLASYNPPRYDARFFSHAKDARAKRRETKPRKAVEIPPRSMAPPTFELERLLAIFHALTETGGQRFVSSAEVGAQLALLTAQNLVIKTQQDPLDSRTKWRVNASESFVRRLAVDLGLPLDEFLV